MLKIFAGILIAFQCLTSLASETITVHVGKVEEISRELLVLDSAHSQTHIGFVATKPALNRLRGIKVGQRVRAEFGSAVRDGMEINKLVGIRVCARRDGECDAVERQASLAEARRSIAYAEREKARKQCTVSMQATLLADQRYIPEERGASLHSSAAFNALEGEARICARKVMKDHFDAYNEACVKHHCYDDIAGGCAHMTGRAGTASLWKKGVDLCRR